MAVLWLEKDLLREHMSFARICVVSRFELMALRPQYPFLATVEYGALTQLYAATAPEAVWFNGKVGNVAGAYSMVHSNEFHHQYLGPWATVRECRSDHNDVGKEDALWEWCSSEVERHAR